MPTVILRGCKEQGRTVSRLVVEGSSTNMIRGGILDGAPFEVTDEEFAKYDQRYVLETVDGKPDDTEPPSPEPEVEPTGKDDGNQEDDS